MSETTHEATPPSTAAPPTPILGNEAPPLAGARVASRSLHRTPIHDGTGRIRIPRIGLDAATFEGIDEATIDRGPSHWPGTAQPGEVGNAVYAGHRVTHTRPFLNIDRLRVGDEVTFEWDGQAFTYRVSDYFVVRRDAVWITSATNDPTFTLFSCHPKYSERERYVVVGELVSRPASSGRDAAAGRDADASPTSTDTTIDESTATSTSTTTAPPCLVCFGRG